MTLPIGPRIGFSYYRDKNGALADAEQTAFGLDLEYAPGDLIVESGFVWPSFEGLDAEGRPNGEFRSPRGAYLLLGYSLQRGLTPFAYYDLYDPDLDLSDDGERDLVLGFNLPVAESVFLKGEVHNFSFEDSTRESYRNFVVSLAVAF